MKEGWSNISHAHKKLLYFSFFPLQNTLRRSRLANNTHKNQLQ